MKWLSTPEHCLGDARRVFYLLACIAVVGQMAALCHITGIVKTPLWHTNRMAAMTHNMMLWCADALALTMPTLLCRRHWRWVQWTVLLLFTAWGVAQLMYFPTYGDLMPPSSFVLWQNLEPLVIDSALGNWTKRCWLFVVPPLVLLIADVAWLRYLPTKQRYASWHWRSLLMAVLAFIVLRVACNALSFGAFWHKEMGLREFVVDNYTHVRVSHASYLAHNGLTGYLAYCTAVEMAQHRRLSEHDEQRIEQFVAQQSHYTDNAYDAHKRNLIMIVVESLNSWVIDLRIDGREVTPVMNALCADTASLVCMHMRRQVKNGGSSDAHFMFNTGLLPLEQRAVAMVYPDTNYPTLIEAMNAKHTAHICGDQPPLWNTEATARTYGYAEFHGGQEAKPLLKNNQWKYDKVILQLATQVLDTISQPFVAQIITLGMHEPYTRSDVPETWISHSGKYTLKVRNYLERVAVLDQELGAFFQKLKQKSLYDNSLIVIVSDHNDHIDDEPTGRPAIDPDGQDCLLLVINSGQGRRIDQPIGQIDVFPTLLDLTGSNDYPWKGLGQSVLRHVSGTVAQGSGDAYGKGPLLQRQCEAWDISRLMIVSKWFDRHPLTQLAGRH